MIINNFTNINKRNSYVSLQIINTKRKTTTYADGNVGLDLGQAHKCDELNQLIFNCFKLGLMWLGNLQNEVMLGDLSLIFDRPLICKIGGNILTNGKRAQRMLDLTINSEQSLKEILI